MHPFNKYPHPENFLFADRFREEVLTAGNARFELKAAALGTDIWHFQAVNDRLWPRKDDGRLKPSWSNRKAHDQESRFRPLINESAGLRLTGPQDAALLEAGEGRWFGVGGRRWMFRFGLGPDMQFYGLGEKHTPFERSGRAYWFWNTDVWADHPMESIQNGDYDPDYLSIPYLIVKQGNRYIGLLVDTAFPAYISLGGQAPVGGAFEQFDQSAPEFFMGAIDGPPSLYIIGGPSLAELTRRYQNLVGNTPLPPVWSLGYHQSRWGYRGDADLASLAHQFERRGFPADGLWLDIDYMDGYRVFTTDSRHLPKPAETVAALKKRGFRVVPILDPGVKREEGYPVYDSGRVADVFCRNPSGGVFTGLVWPGLTVFPDFSLSETRKWWAGYARTFFELGYEGAWLDMNDPSTGAVDCRDLLFDHGRQSHEAYRNRYALLMARATHDGLTAAWPDRRPFLLSRSGSTGSQKYCAHWTGDNFSSYRHLQRSIGKSLNLALSGVPFNGADVGGFGGDCTEALLIDWFKAAFLMPFLRNHTMRGSRAQEPWTYSDRAFEVIRRFVRLRYTLLPYLYNLFIDQEERGEAVWRPLFYEFDEQPEMPLAHVDDQFMVGPAIMQAPFVQEKGRHRELVLPGHRWLRADTGRWIQGGRRLQVRRQFETTPLFLREGSLVPFQPGKRTDNRKDFNRIGLLCCLSSGFLGRAHLRYRADDGESFEYRQGRRTDLEVTAEVEGRRLHLRVKTISKGYGPVTVEPFSVNRFRDVRFEVDGKRRTLYPVKEKVQLTGRPFEWYRWTAPRQ